MTVLQELGNGLQSAESETVLPEIKQDDPKEVCCGVLKMPKQEFCFVFFFLKKAVV